MHRPPRGFTLVEVLVALLIMAVLATMAWQGVDGIVRARDISQAQMDHSARLNTVMAQWDQDLLSIYDSPVVPGLAFDGGTVRIARRAQGGVQMVAWSLRGDRWWRWTGPVVTGAAELQESWLRSQQLLGNEPEQLMLLEGVTDVQVHFFQRGGGGWSNSQSTGDVNTAGAGRPGSETLPLGARLLLSFGEQRLLRDVVLPPQMP